MAVSENFRGLRVLFGRHVARVLKQWQIHIRLNVASSIGITIPVPGTTKVAGFFDDTEIGNSGLRQIGGLNHSSEATTNDDNINVFDHRITGKAGLDVRVTIELFVIALEFFVLADAVGAKTLFAFNAILLASFFQRKFLVVVIPHGWHSPSRLSAYLSSQE